MVLIVSVPVCLSMRLVVRQFADRTASIRDHRTLVRVFCSCTSRKVTLSVCVCVKSYIVYFLLESIKIAQYIFLDSELLPPSQ